MIELDWNCGRGRGEWNVEMGLRCSLRRRMRGVAGELYISEGLLS
jgi:hypothetical protein